MSYSVTEVLNYLTEPELISWMLRTSKKKREDILAYTNRVGKAVDLLIQQDITDGGYLLPEGDEPIENCMKAWESFKVDHPEFLPSVIKMQEEVSLGNVIGHPDFVRMTQDRFGITDLKCTNAIRTKNWTQTAKYLHMNRGIGCNHKEFLSILRLDRETGKYEYKEITDPSYIEYEIKVFDAYELAFNHALTNREQLRLELERDVLDVS